jgi:hypothetical protein
MTPAWKSCRAGVSIHVPPTPGSRFATIKNQKGPARAQATRRARRGARGYPSDLTGAQWQVIAPYLPAEVSRRRDRPRLWPIRRIVEAILYLDQARCAWRSLPADFPPFMWNQMAGCQGLLLRASWP